MEETRRNRRLIGGHRVKSLFNLYVKDLDPFKPSVNNFSGTLVFNARGGCLFLSDAVLARTLFNLIENEATLVESFEFVCSERETHALRNVRIKYLRAKEIAGYHGFVFKFIQSTEETLNLLNDLVDRLEPVENDMEALSVYENVRVS